MKYNSRIEMLFRLFPTAILDVEAIKEGQSPFNIANDDIS
jgi:hypothetical protein